MSDSKLYAYKLNAGASYHGDRDPAKDFDRLKAAGNGAPRGIWSGGTTMWVVDANDDKIYAHKMSDMSPDPGKDYNSLSVTGNEYPYGIWSDGTTMWVADPIAEKIYAYESFFPPPTPTATPLAVPPDGGSLIVASKRINIVNNGAPSGTTIEMSGDAFNALPRNTTVTFSSVSPGSSSAPVPSSNRFTIGGSSAVAVDITINPSVNGAPVEVCIPITQALRDALGSEVSELKMLHYDEDSQTWTALTTTIKTSNGVATEACATTTSFSVFLLGAKVITIPGAYMASRIEPGITEVNVSAGDEIRLTVDIFGRQNIQDQTLGEHHKYLWRENDVIVAGEQSSELVYIAPSSAGTYNLVAFLSGRYCAGDLAACSAEFVVRVIRSSSLPQSPTPEPVNPAGEIADILADGDGNQHEVFTPEDGGKFGGETFSISAPSSAVQSGEIIGVRMYESGDASNVGMTHHRYTLGGSRYGISVVDSEGDSVSSYRLNAAAKVCVPLPDELSSNISDIAILATNADGSFTVLTSSVRISTTGTQVCGNISELPASVAVGKLGAPAPIPAPTPEPTPEAPDTGGASPSAAAILWLVLLGVAIATVSGFVVRGRHA